MRIQVTNRKKKPELFESMVGYVSNRLDVTEDNTRKTVDDAIENIVVAMGRLLEILVTIGIIDLNDVRDIVSFGNDRSDTVGVI